MRTRRQLRVGELLREEISSLIQQEMRDPRLGFVTVTSVEVSSNLRHAHVYVSIIGDPEATAEALAALDGARGFFRHELGARLSLRYVPDVAFHLDKSIERGQHVLDLLDKVSGNHEA